MSHENSLLSTQSALSPLASSTASHASMLPQVAITSIAPPTLEQIPWSAIQLGEQIGEGGFGQVYKASYFGIPVAVKQLHLKSLNTAMKTELEQEARMMANCYFPYIVRLYGICIEAGHNSLIMEYVARGSLYEMLHNPDELLPWSPIRWQIGIDIGLGLSYLHSKNIVHRDLKSHNIFIDQNYTAKIGDFGLAKIKLETATTTNFMSKPTAGSTRWQAPELFSLKPKYSAASDIYAYAMVMWELVSRQIPYNEVHDEKAIRDYVKDGEREEIPADCPAALENIIKACWDKNPELRPRAEAVVKQLQKNFPKPEPAPFASAEKSWHFSGEVKASASVKEKGYALLDAPASDVDKVVQFYLHHAVAGYDIKSVRIIYNPTMNRGFELKMKMLQERAGNPAFRPTWDQESNPTWRKEVNNLWNNLTAVYADSAYPDVKLIPAWHGTNTDIVDSVLKTGYANLATTDSGFFGKGIYSTHEAEYAYRVYSKGGALIVNWVASFSAYPVIDGDMSKLAEHGNYKNYDAHFVPVVASDPSNPDEITYYPCKPNQKHTYTEVVVFESSQCLPRYLVELQPSLPKSLPVIDPQSALEKAATHAYITYLSKPFTAPGGPDREYVHKGIKIERPNHGLAHTLRCVSYAPYVVEAYNKRNPGNKISAEDLERIQIALVFHVAGRRNDMSSADDAALYQEARAASAKAFEDYVKAHLPVQFPEATHQFFAHAIYQLSGYGEQHPLMLIINLCHYLDLRRCLEKEICEGIYNAYIPYLGAEALEQLKACAQQCLIATGDRIMEKQDYQGDIFIASSQNVEKCIENIQKGIKQWQASIEDKKNQEEQKILEKIKEEKEQQEKQEKQDIPAPEVLSNKNEIELPVTTSLLSSLTSSSQISAASSVSNVGLFAQAKTSNDKVIEMAKSVQKAVDVEEVKALLKWVTEGHLEEAEKLLQKNPKLALVPGTIKDLSERTFENITAFQLAVWYLDDEMWGIILKYLDKAQAKLQLETLKKDRKDITDKHGLHFNFDPLIKAYDDFTTNYFHWSDDQRKEHWCKKVGGEQRNVPAWFIYAFCQEGSYVAWLRWSKKNFNVRAFREYQKAHYMQWCHKHLGTFAWRRAGLEGGDSTIRSERKEMWWGVPSNAWRARYPNGIGFNVDDKVATQQLKSRQAQQLSILKAELSALQMTVNDPILLTSSLTSSSQISASSSVSNFGLFAQANTSNDKVMAMAKSVEKEVNAEEVRALLKWVTEGNLEEAEKLLQNNRKLALATGTIKDLSERTFENITAFQLAVWYLDNEMWEVILKYLDKIHAKIQLEALENDRKDIHDKYSKHFNFQKTLDRYQEYLVKCKTIVPGYHDVVTAYWCKEIGGVQREWPAWMVFAFVHQGFGTSWTTKDLSLAVPRHFYPNALFQLFNIVYNNGRLGETWAGLRGKAEVYQDLLTFVPKYKYYPYDFDVGADFAEHDASYIKLVSLKHKELLVSLQHSLDVKLSPSNPSLLSSPLTFSSQASVASSAEKAVDVNEVKPY